MKHEKNNLFAYFYLIKSESEKHSYKEVHRILNFYYPAGYRIYWIFDTGLLATSTSTSNLHSAALIRGGTGQKKETMNL